MEISDLKTKQSHAVFSISINTSHPTLEPGRTVHQQYNLRPNYVILAMSVLSIAKCDLLPTPHYIAEVNNTNM
jgi:hypothetical protein